MDYVKIDGRAWDVLVTAVSENFNILYSENTGRTVADGGEMYLDPIGSFWGHNVTFARKRGHEAEFDELFDYFGRPRSVGIAVEIVHDQETLSYDAYVSSGSRALKRIDPRTGRVLWDKISVNFIPMKARYTPYD